MDFEQSLGLVRLMIGNGIPEEEAINNPVILDEFRHKIRNALHEEGNFILEPARILVANPDKTQWINDQDRSTWYYWPTLRSYLLGKNNWSLSAVRSLDETSDRILKQLACPSDDSFDIRGLVIGYVQSGKTANYTALISKAVDVGYRLIIVLSGIDNGLRRQTQIRLNQELVGYSNNNSVGVNLPPIGKQWHQFTSEDINGDFQPGYVNYGALQGSQPVLLVIKKNGAVLRRLHKWLDEAPEKTRKTLPAIIIDDEADQASIDTRGSYTIEGEEPPDDFEEPTIINKLIRDLLKKFRRKAYVAYTATPFANILIPHDAFNPKLENDLYPKDFIVDLPKPEGYFGAEELFGRSDRVTGEKIVEGLNIVRLVSENEFSLIAEGKVPPSLENAILDFVLSGAARSFRGQGNSPSTMLLHGSHLIIKQSEMKKMVEDKFNDLRDEWRYQKNLGILDRLNNRWNSEFRPFIQLYNITNDCKFTEIESHIGKFFEQVQVKEINSRTGDVLNYEIEPNLKAIAIGGNRLSRGLTLGGLTISYFFRSSAMYDTLMQMGRWFGFRKGYEDLSRIYITNELASWFSDLAMVEHELRDDIRLYEIMKLTPLELGPRIIKHPAMLVTSRLKQRHANNIIIEQSYSNKFMQTFRYPFDRPKDLSNLLDNNKNEIEVLVSKLGLPKWEKSNPIWKNIDVEFIMNFFENFVIDKEARNISLPLIYTYIKRVVEMGELRSWVVSIKGRESENSVLGSINLGLEKNISLISRTRLRSDPNSLGVITSPGDELTGLNQDIIASAESLSKDMSINLAARMLRDPSEGLLLIYPISHKSGYDLNDASFRIPIYDDAEDEYSKDILGIAISFPISKSFPSIKGEYLVGSVTWRSIQ